MKWIVRLVCCSAAMVWMHGAIAGAAATAKPSATKVPVKAQPHKVDRKRIEARMQQRSARTHARTELAEKDVAERKAKAQPATKGARK